MWFLVLTFNVIAFFVIFKILDHRITNSSPLDDLVRRHRKEVDSTMVLFNKTAFENISALESKLQETKELVRLLEKRLQEAKNLPAGKSPARKSVASEVSEAVRLEEAPVTTAKLDVVVDGPRNVVPFSLSQKNVSRKPKNKKEMVVDLFNQGETIASIASQLDISQEEVKYYVKRFVRV